jgi:acyl-coenzyme A thioesterase PaaI-like protein
VTVFDVPRGTDRFAIVPGAVEAGYRASDLTEPVVRRRDAVADVGAQLRRLRIAATATEQSAEVLEEVATALAAVADRLEGGPRRSRQVPSSSDDLVLGVRMYNPVWGPGSVIAPPMELAVEDTGVTGRCTLDLAYEGPPGYAHGGVSAMLLDELFGLAVAAAGHASVTRSLRVDYRGPVPLQVPIDVHCAFVESGEGGLLTRGTISVDGQVLVRGEGLFVVLGAQQVRRFLAPPDESS